MNIKKTALWVMAAMFLLLVLLLGLSQLDLGFCKSEIATNRTGISTLESLPGESKSPMSYDLTILYDGQLVSASSHQIVGMPTLPIEVNVIPVITGNTWVPFNKTFEVAFSSSFEASSPDGQFVFEGDLNGTAQAKVTGLCSQRKALELAQDDIVKTVQTYFEKQLTDK
jgi:hypothetical protein